MMSGAKSMKILIAEDDELIGELLGEILVEMGHVVCAIKSTETGTVNAALQFQPDLMIVDSQLSPGSGIDAVDRIIQTRPVAHIMVSGNIASVRERRPDAIMLQKPYTRLSLASAILRASEAHVE